MQGSAGPVSTLGVNVTSWARDALASLCERPGVHRAGVGLAEGGGRRLRFTASNREIGSASEWCLIDAYDDIPLNTAMRTAQPVLGSLGDLGHRYASFVQAQEGTPTVALAAVPLVTAGHVLGGFVLFYESPPTFGVDLRTDLSRTAEVLGTALRRAQRNEPRATLSLASDPAPSGAVAAVSDVSSDPAAVARARRFLRATLEDWGVAGHVADTAVLCLSELVTNAVIHADAGCAVRVLLDGDVLTVTVRNSGQHPAALGSLDDPLRVHGRGLQLVEALATRWGSDLDTSGTKVWFDLSLRGA